MATITSTSPRRRWVIAMDCQACFQSRNAVRRRAIICCCGFASASNIPPARRRWRRFGSATCACRMLPIIRAAGVSVHRSSHRLDDRLGDAEVRRRPAARNGRRRFDGRVGLDDLRLSPARSVCSRVSEPPANSPDAVCRASPANAGSSANERRQDATTSSAWTWRSLPASIIGDLPFYAWGCGRHDGFATWQEQVDMVKALTAARHGFAFAWNNGDHSSGSQAMANIHKYYSGRTIRPRPELPGVQSQFDRPATWQRRSEGWRFGRWYQSWFSLG